MTQFKTTLIAALIAAAAAATAGSAAAASNLVTNGDFEAGNTSFHSDYQFSAGDLWNGATYDVATNPFLDHNLFAAFGDHTTGAGKMMEINGSGTDHAIIWGQDNIAVAANTSYLFSFWMASEYPDSPAVLRLNINGDALGSAFLATSDTGVWNNYSMVWNSGAATSINLALWNENTELSGNDFALDDISLTSRGIVSLDQPLGVPEPSSWALMLTGFFGLGSVLRRSRRQLAPSAI